MKGVLGMAQRSLSQAARSAFEALMHEVAGVGSVRELFEHVPAPRPTSRKATAAGRAAHRSRSQQ